MALLGLIRLELMIGIHFEPIYAVKNVLQRIIGTRHFLRLKILIVNTYGG